MQNNSVVSTFPIVVLHLHSSWAFLFQPFDDYLLSTSLNKHFITNFNKKYDRFSAVSQFIWNFEAHSSNHKSNKSETNRGVIDGFEFGFVLLWFVFLDAFIFIAISEGK